MNQQSSFRHYVLKPLSKISSVLFLVAVVVNGHAATSERQRILLDSDWRFYRGELASAVGQTQGLSITRWRWVADDVGKTDSGKMADPALDTSGGDWKDATTGQDTFNGRVGFAWFRTTLPGDAASGRTLHFDGVDDNATVYLNGVKLTTHEGWDDPFDVDLRPAWKQGGPNVLAVLVENTAGVGGITMPVFLENQQANQAAGPAVPRFDDNSWRVVHLPHDFIVEGTFAATADRNHGFLPTTTGWYRKTFELPASANGKSLWIDFDGVYRDSSVWLNGQFLGRHKSGYTSFRYDIGKVANYGGKNVLAVHVDPRHFEGWWYEGGGIYRHVWLNLADPLHAAPWGTFVAAELPEPAADGKVGLATVHVQTTLTNDSPASADCTLVLEIMDDRGRTVATASTPATVPAGEKRQFAQNLMVQEPRLWSIETPRLYRLATTVRRGGRTADTTETRFGIRTIRFDAEKGFFLNGKPVKIQGTCNHQDFAGIGIAVPDTLEYWRVRTLQNMGANAWRMSHNPPTPSLLDACDDLGMLVMDENRHLGDSPDNLAEVAGLVQRDRNHPSIIMWSMCNEEGAAGTAAGGRTFAAMKSTVLEYDTSRPVSSAMNSGWFDNGFTAVSDLMGVNYNTEVYDRFHREHPAMPLYASETASTTTTRGEYANNRAEVYATSYNLTDDTWRSVAERPFVAGSFVWTGFDYKGEPTPYDWPSINSHFGIMDMCGFPKDNYYYYTSWWKMKPTVHLMPHWNWPGKEGQDIRVIAFSNCRRVELFLNGQSLGVKEVPPYRHVEWEVKYAPGTLSANGLDDAGKVILTDKVETTGAPASLRLKTDRTALAADGEDLAPIEVDVLDAQGSIVPTADNLVTFEVGGAGRVAGVGNGNPGDHDPDKANHRHAFHGKCMVIVGAGQTRGSILLTANSPGLKSATLRLQAGN
jgi:beta-galactosidase